MSVPRYPTINAKNRIDRGYPQNTGCHNTKTFRLGTGSSENGTGLYRSFLELSGPIETEHFRQEAPNGANDWFND